MYGKIVADLLSSMFGFDGKVDLKKEEECPDETVVWH